MMRNNVSHSEIMLLQNVIKLKIMGKRKEKVNKGKRLKSR
jgi:hypothetical protein